MVPLRPTPWKQPRPELQFIQRGDSGFVTVASSSGISQALYPLCPVPSSLIDWMVTACQGFWQEHQRCIAFMLLFNPLRQHWSIDLPYQKCRASGSDWPYHTTPSPPRMPGYYLAGSFQSQPAEHTGMPLPPFTGMHLLLGLKQGPMQLHAFMSWNAPEQRLERVQPGLLVQNDYHHMLQVAAPRIQLL